MVDLYFMSVVVFFLLIGIMIYHDRKKIEFGTLMVMRKTKRFGDIINKLAKLNPKFWKILFCKMDD